MVTKRKPPGTPKKTDTRITAAVEQKILERLRDGETLLQVCDDPKMPTDAAVRKRALNNKKFGSDYAAAREIGYLKLADEIKQISDDKSDDVIVGSDGELVLNHTATQRAKLQIDTRKWMLSKMLPKVYGDKQQVDVTLDATEAFAKIWAKMGGDK